MQTNNSSPQPAPGPRPGSIAHTAALRRDAQARLRLDHTVRSEALKLGADPQTAEDLALESRSVFAIVNAIPTARDPNGQLIIGDNGFPLTPEGWLRSRLSSHS